MNHILLLGGNHGQGISTVMPHRERCKQSEMHPIAKDVVT